jgi:predicted small secreted protein
VPRDDDDDDGRQIKLLPRREESVDGRVVEVSHVLWTKRLRAKQIEDDLVDGIVELLLCNDGDDIDVDRVRHLVLALLVEATALLSSLLSSENTLRGRGEVLR